jgi:hypothetical protein
VVQSYVLPQVGVTAEAAVATDGRWRDDEGSGDQESISRHVLKERQTGR